MKPNGVQVKESISRSPWRGHAEDGEKLGMDFCRSATTWNLAYKIYKVGIFPKSVAGKCPTKFNEAEYGRNFS